MKKYRKFFKKKIFGSLGTNPSDLHLSMWVLETHFDPLS